MFVSSWTFPHEVWQLLFGEGRFVIAITREGEIISNWFVLPRPPRRTAELDHSELLGTRVKAILVSALKLIDLSTLKSF